MKILVFMVGLLGDVLIRTPVLRELRKAYPRAEIFAVADPIGAELLALSGDIDQVIQIDRSRSKKWRYIWEKVRVQSLLFKLKIDLLVDLYGGPSSRKMAAFISANQKLIVHSGVIQSKGLSKERHLVFENPYHMANTPIGILAYIPSKKCFDLDTTPHLVFDPEMVAGNEKIVLEKALGESSGFILSMGSGDPRKIIDLECIADLCVLIGQDYGYYPLLVRNPGQEFLQERLISLLSERKVKHEVLPVLSLNALAYALDQVNFTILPDTGLYHLALGIGTPTLGIFTHTNPELVRPSKGIHEVCFKVDASKGLSPEGLPFGSQHLELGILKAAADRLINRIKEARG